MKRVLVTGGAGFIAHHFVKKIIDETDWDIVCLDRLDFSGDLNRLSEIIEETQDRQRIQVVHHDLRAEINDSVASRIGHIDYIVHIAAGSHVDRSIEDPMSFVLDNVVGTTNILDYARHRGCEQFIYFSTDEIFGPAPKGVFYSEYDRYNSTNPYSATKAAAEELVVAYHNTYKLPAIITHTMNVFGERQNVEKFMPLCIRKILAGESVTIHADPTLTKAGSRHYIHAGDVADAVLFLMKNTQYDLEIPDHSHKCQKFNIVGSQEIDNLSLAKMIAKILDKELKYELTDFHSARPGHDLRYALSGERMASIGWTPNTLEETLRQTVLWTINNPRWLSQ